MSWNISNNIEAWFLLINPLMVFSCRCKTSLKDDFSFVASKKKPTASEKAISARIISRRFTLTFSHYAVWKRNATGVSALPILLSVFRARFLRARIYSCVCPTPGGCVLLRNYRHCHARLDLFCLFGGKVLSFGATGAEGKSMSKAWRKRTERTVVERTENMDECVARPRASVLLDKSS